MSKIAKTKIAIINDDLNVFSSPLELKGIIPDRATKEQIAAVKPGEVVYLQRHEIAAPCRQEDAADQPRNFDVRLDIGKVGSICAEKDRAVKDAQKRERREARAAARKANANEGGASDKLITISHAACIIGVSPTTLRAWIDKGELPTWVSPGGRVRVREEDARGFWQRRGNTPK